MSVRSVVLGIALVVLAPGTETGRPDVCFASDAEVGIDHVVVAVRDLDDTQGLLERQGFNTKAGRLHQNGLRNAHYKFGNGTSLEFMTLDGPASDEMSRDYDSVIRAGGGGAFLALRALQESVREAGESSGVQHEVLSVRPFMYVTFPGPSLANVFSIEYERPVVDEPAQLIHPNGAEGISEVWLESGPELGSLLDHLGARRCGERTSPEGLIGLEYGVANGSVMIVPWSSERRPRVLRVKLGTDVLGERVIELPEVPIQITLGTDPG